ncbi:MAG: DNA cytosine methyltransferase, partial [Proteobacteria bacterium]|nr:DNA cytosine methyltransferase [Pseudomonadota bacterium]
MPQLVSPSETVADLKVGMQSEKNLGMKTASIPVLSFFSGLGLLDLGFHSAGMTPIWHNEVSKDFKTIFEFGMESFGINGPSAKIQNTNSIVNIGPNEILRQAFGKSGTPSVFGIIGGPPCPDFSVGGKNKGSEGERGKLSQTYVRRILELQPTFFVFENVPGLIRTQKHREFLAGLLSQLLTNYKVDAQILNSLE